MNGTSEPQPSDRKVQTPQWESLTEEQRAAIEQGPGWVSESVELKKFEDTDEFRTDNGTRDSLNFTSFFRRVGMVAEEYEKVPAFQRLKIIFPEIVQDLDARMELCGGQPDDSLWEDLMDAYNRMKVLVDQSDPGVVKNGEIDPLALLH